MTPRVLGWTEYKEIERIGDILAPGDDTLPAFSQCGFAEHADRMLLYLPEGERVRLRRFLRFTRLLPLCAVRVLLRSKALDRFLPNFAALPLRKLELGLRGLVFSLYYSFLDTPSGCGRRIQEAVGWDAAIRTRPELPDDLPELIRGANPLETSAPNEGGPSDVSKPSV